MKKYFCLLLILIASCASKKDKPLRFVSVLSFNLQNLYDTQHDSGRLDYAYLPLSVKKGPLRRDVENYCSHIKKTDWQNECRELDWNNYKFNEKLLRIARIMDEAISGCADIVVLQEVENNYVLRRLKETSQCDYPYTVLSSDQNSRGLQIAILSKFPIPLSYTDKIPFQTLNEDTKKSTQSILHAKISLPGLELHLMGIQLPSSAAQLQMRKEALYMLEALYLKDAKPVVIAGDWNISEKENQTENMLNEIRRSFLYSDDAIRASSSDRGTFYDSKEKSWSFLDKIAWSHNAFDQVECKVVNYLPGQRAEGSGEPLAFPFFGKMTEGVSNHFPVLCRASY